MASVIKEIYAAPPVMEIQQAVINRLPDQIIGNGQWIVTDMDGTVIGAPTDVKEPTLGESVAIEPLCNWLRAGGSILLLTGCETDRTIERFAAFLPEDVKPALVERRLLLATNGGSVINYYDGTTWREDVNFRKSALVQRELVIPQESAEYIVEHAVSLINRFYKELAEDQDFVEKSVGKEQAGKYNKILRVARENPNGFTREQLLTLKATTVPRIEVRKAEKGAIVQIAIIGIPVDFKYDVSDLKLDQIGGLEMVKVSFTHEINVAGVDKALSVRWLQGDSPDKIGYPKFDKDKSLALGDRPAHNDAPLTRAVGAFVSVCERKEAEYNPAHVTLRIGHNQEGSAKLISGLLAKAEEFAKLGTLEAVIPATLQDVVHEIHF